MEPAMLTATEIAGFVGAGLAGAAYIPQISHLIRARCALPHPSPWPDHGHDCHGGGHLRKGAWVWAGKRLSRASAVGQGHG
jgi:hypothetical protein